MTRWLATALALGLADTVRAEDGAPLTKTRKAVRDRSTLLIGVRDGASLNRPMSAHRAQTYGLPGIAAKRLA